VKTCLEKAVKRHLISDGAHWRFFKRGLDSSIIASIASKYQQPTKKRSQSILTMMPIPKGPTRIYLQKQLHGEHHQFLIKENDFHTQFTPYHQCHGPSLL
jgi:asparagine synthetase B (glutamine-hydrolysing)